MSAEQSAAVRLPAAVYRLFRRYAPPKSALWPIVGVFVVTILLSPHLPCIDLPQHIALASLLRRLWSGDAAVMAVYTQNAATHNGGLHWSIAALGTLGIRPEVAARWVIATYPPLLLGGVVLMLRRAGLPTWRALLVVPTLFGISFGWGLVNFCLGGGLAWFAVALVLGQLRQPRIGRALSLCLLSLVLGVTHVMAMLLCAVIAAAVGVEWFLGVGRRTFARACRVALAGAPLLLGCAYDVWVARAHLASDGGAYTTPAGAEASTSILHKLASFVGACSGLYTSRIDVVLAAFALLLLGALVVQGCVDARRASKAVSGCVAGDRTATLNSTEHCSAETSQRADTDMPPSFWSPAALLAIAYLVTPNVFLNTHLIGPRLAQWVVVALLLAAPASSFAIETKLRRIATVIASLSAIAAPLHFYAYNYELRGLDEALAAFPPNAMGVGVIEDARAAAMRLPTLTHIAALQVARGGLDDAFGFARWMSFPIVYKANHPVTPYPSPSWEHDGRLYDATTPLARRYPWVLVRTANTDESNDVLVARLFGNNANAVRLVARHDRWAVIDSSALTPDISSRQR